MPEFATLGQSLFVSAFVAAACVLAAAALARAPSGVSPPVARLPWLGSGQLAGLAAGVYVGCGLLGQWPRWPALEDRDRALAILLPMAFLAEAAALFIRRRWLAWLPRTLLAGAAAPILLHDSIYLADLSGPDSAEWSAAQAVLILLGMATLLLAVWVLLALLQSRAGDRGASPAPRSPLSPSLALALACLAAGATVMLSGYFTGGRLGLPLAGALAGVALASLAAPRQPHGAPAGGGQGGPALGIGTIGLFTLLVIGRFFGSLPTGTALCLFLAPLLAWMAEAPGVRRLWPGLRAVFGLFLVAAVLALLVARAQRRFIDAFAPRTTQRNPAGRAQGSRATPVAESSRGGSSNVRAHRLGGEGDLLGLYKAYEAAGVDPRDLTVTAVQRGAPFGDSLKSLLKPHGLVFRVESSGLVVTTLEAAKRDRRGISSLRRALPSLNHVEVWW